MNCDDIRHYSPLYLSGELDARSAADFDRHLEGCADCAREVGEQRELDAAVRAAFAGQSLESAATLRERIRAEISRDAPGASATPLAAARKIVAFPRWLSPLRLAVAALVIGVLTFGAMRWIGGSRTADDAPLFREAAAHYQHDIVQRLPQPDWIKSPPQIEAFVAERLATSAVAEKLQPVGFTLMRVRPCPLAGEPFVHLVYKNAEAREISFFVRHAATPSAATPRSSRPPAETVAGQPLRDAMLDRLGVAGFQAAAYTVVVVSDLPTPEVRRMARNAAARLASMGASASFFLSPSDKPDTNSNQPKNRHNI
jgi:anti-sigma factor RsiW